MCSRLGEVVDFQWRTGPLGPTRLQDCAPDPEGSPWAYVTKAWEAPLKVNRAAGFRCCQTGRRIKLKTSRHVALLLAWLTLGVYAQEPRATPSGSVDGIGARAHLDITKDDLYHVFVQDTLQLLFNEGTQFGTPVTLRELHGGQRTGYSIDAMAAGVDQRGAVVRAVVPIGAGTVFEIFGKVQLFGNNIANDGDAPLVLMAHNARNLDQLKPNFRTSGRLTPVPLYLPVKTLAQKAPANLPDGVVLQLVHIAGKGIATLSDGGKILFEDTRP